MGCEDEGGSKTRSVLSLGVRKGRGVCSAKFDSALSYR
jgi:hypothetical protein